MKFPVVSKTYPLFRDLVLNQLQINKAETQSKLEAVWFCDFTACHNGSEDEYHRPTDTNSKFTVSLYVRLSFSTLTFKSLMN